MSRLSLLLGALLLTAVTVQSEPPRTALKSPPQIAGRGVKELVLTAPVRLGAPLGPGMPTVRVYTVRPNRFVPVSEDDWYVYYQADGALAEGSGQTGGLCVSKKYPDRVATYWGNARYLKIKVSGGYDVLSPADVKKIRVRYVDLER